LPTSATFSHGTRIAKIDLATCETLMHRSLPDRYFGEGIVIIGSKLFQLTWTSKVGPHAF
jgi:glutamine cyclotransferase